MKMEVVAATINVFGLTLALLQTHLPAYLLGIILSSAWSCVMLELKTMDKDILENELGWKLRRDCSKGVFCLLLLPCAVLLTTFQDLVQLRDDFSKILIIMSVAAILVPLAILSYTLLLTAQKPDGGEAKPGTADKDKDIPESKSMEKEEKKEEKEEKSSEKTKKQKSKSKKQKSTSESKSDETQTTQSPDTEKDSTKDSAEIKKDTDRNSAPKSSKSTASKDTTSKSTSGKDTTTKSTASKDDAPMSTAAKDTTSKSTAAKDTTSKSTVGKDTTSKSTASKDTASKNTESKDTASKESASKSTTPKDTASADTASQNTTAAGTHPIQLQKNLSTVLNVSHLVIVVAFMLFMMMVSLRTVGFKATVLLGMHGLLLSILLTTLPVLTPRSFSLGEATVVAQALTYFQLLLSSQLWYRFEWLKIESSRLASVSEVTAFTEVALLSCILVVVVLLFWPGWRSSAGVYVLIPGVALVFSLPSLYTILGTDFVSWVLAYVSGDITKRYLFVYWALASILAVMSVYFNTSYLKQIQEANKPNFHLPAKIRNRIRATQKLSQPSPEHPSSSPTSLPPSSALQRRSSTEAKVEAEVAACRGGVTTAVRKQFHVLAVCVFVPGLVLDPQLTMCAWTCALIVFVMLECLRIVEVYPWHSILDDHLKVFLDSRDEGPVILTPIYLLAGCTLPLWLYQGQGSHIALLSGVLSLGIGDTAASVVGSKFGKHKWRDSPKSIEGTAANIISQLACLWGLVYTGYCPAFRWDLLIPAVVATSFVEAFTLQIDNLVLPLFLYCLTVSH